MKILPEQPSWSPYPMGVAASIPREVSFFVTDSSDRTRTLLFSRLDREERKFVLDHRRDLIEFWSADKPIDEQVMAIRAAHFAHAKTYDDKLASKTSFDCALEMSIAKTELVREISDGIPIIIGEDESTKPTHAPKASTAVFTDGLVRSEGMKW